MDCLKKVFIWFVLLNLGEAEGLPYVPAGTGTTGKALVTAEKVAVVLAIIKTQRAIPDGFPVNASAQEVWYV
jgi:hypothetical protein